jgi:hypothetical protein
MPRARDFPEARDATPERPHISRRKELPPTDFQVEKERVFTKVAALEWPRGGGCFDVGRRALACVSGWAWMLRTKACCDSTRGDPVATFATTQTTLKARRHQ